MKRLILFACVCILPLTLGGWSTPAPKPATNITHNSVTLNGNLLPDGDNLRWRFEYRKSAVTAWQATPFQTLNNPGTATRPVSLNLTGLAASTAYTARLCVEETTGTKPVSKPDRTAYRCAKTSLFTTKAVPVAAPTNIQVSAKTDTSITITWTKQGGSTFKVYRSNPASYTVVGNVATHTFTGLTPNTSYELNVASQNPEKWGSAITASTTAPPPPPPPVEGFRVGVTDREWFDNDVAAQQTLGYKFVRYGDGPMTQAHAEHYKAKGIKVVRLSGDSSQWAQLRDDWNKYGPDGTVIPGIVIALELGNEESMQHRTNDPYAAGRSHGDFAHQLATAVSEAPLVCQGDDSYQANPDPRFFNGMKDANPAIAADCDMYSIHPYVTSYTSRMPRNRIHIDDILNDDGAKFYVSEYGVAARRDGGCITDDSNYGCVTLDQAAARLYDAVNYFKGRGDVQWVTLYQNTDQQNGSGAREHNFGLTGVGGVDKGAYTQAAKEVIASNP